MIPKIENPSDWYEVDKILKKLTQTTPEFFSDYRKLAANIEIKIKELSKIDLNIRRHSTIEQQNKRKEKLEEINNIIRLFSKMHLLASLAKR